MDTPRKSNMEYHGIPKLATVIAKGTCSSSNLKLSKIFTMEPPQDWSFGSMLLLFRIFFKVPAVSFVFFFHLDSSWDALVWPICDVKGWALSKVIPQKAGFGPG